MQQFLKSIKHHKNSLDPSNPKNNLNKPFFWVVLIVIFIVFVTLLRLIGSLSQPKEGPQKEKPFRVEVMESKARDKTVYYTAQAFLEAKQKALLRAETDGLVSKVYAEKGQELKANDPILDVAIESRLAKLREAQATLAQRKMEYDNSLSLQSSAFRSKTAVADSKSKFESAKAAYESIKQDIKDTKIRAPFDGRLDYRRIQEGDYVKTGDELGVFVNLNPMLVVINVPENILESVQVGQKAFVTFGAQKPRTQEGRVSFVSHVADSMTRTFRIEIEVSNDDLKIYDGVTAKVNLPIKQTKAHVLSPSVLSLDDSGQVGVKIVDDQHIVHFHPVTVVNHDAEGIWLDGVKDTELVIINGQDFVAAGQKVEGVVKSSKDPK